MAHYKVLGSADKVMLSCNDRLMQEQAPYFKKTIKKRISVKVFSVFKITKEEVTKL